MLNNTLLDMRLSGARLSDLGPLVITASLSPLVKMTALPLA